MGYLFWSIVSLLGYMAVLYAVSMALEPVLQRRARRRARRG